LYSNVRQAGRKLPADVHLKKFDATTKKSLQTSTFSPILASVVSSLNMSDNADSELTAIQENPYSILRRLDIARKYATLGYPDLAAGEAYMALLLIDEIREDGGEYHEEAVEAAIQDRGEEECSEEDTVNWAVGQVGRDT
jgi:hypothetical protein